MIELNAETALRMTGAYALERLSAAKQDFDLLDALIVTSVAQANLDPVYRDARLKLDFATSENCPSDALRRPISINALAQSMGLPFETVRRRIVGLSAQDLLRTSKQGVFAPAETDQGPARDAALAEGYDKLRGLHERLETAGWASPANVQSRLWTGGAPTRLAARLSTDFTLRLIRSLTSVVGDPMAVAVWLTILCGDGSGRACGRMRISQIARRLKLPSETARRRVQALAARGLCDLTEAGALVDATQLSAPPFEDLAQRNLHDLRRLFVQLGEQGVVDAWRVAPRMPVRPAIVARAA